MANGGPSRNISRDVLCFCVFVLSSLVHLMDPKSPFLLGHTILYGFISNILE